MTTGSAAEATLSIGGQSYELTTCWSGDREYFLGVDLTDREKRVRLRAVVDPMDGPRLKLVWAGNGSSQSLSLLPSSCRRLETQIVPTGWRVNHVRDFSGLVDADCTSDGLEVVAHVRFTHCH